MNELSHITTDQLKEELSRREAEGHSPDQAPYLGLLDIEGLDAIVEVDAKKFAEVLKPLQLRARFNSHRKPEIFFVKLPKEMAMMFERDRGVKTAEAIKKLSNYQTINY